MHYPTRASSCLLLALLALFGLVAALPADTLIMKDGRKIEGKIVGKTADGYIVEVASGAKKITAVYPFSAVREIQMNPVTSNDRLMTDYNQRLVEASKNGVEGYRALARWCAQHDELADERKGAWRALLGLAPDDEEAHAGLGQVKGPKGNWESIDERMAEQGFVRRGNTWMRLPAAAAAGNGANGAALPPAGATPGTTAATQPSIVGNSVLQRSGVNQLYGGTTGYTATVSGPDGDNTTIFYGRTGYPYLSALDGTGLGIYVPLYSYPGVYYLTTPPGPYTGPNLAGNNPNLTLADRHLTGPMFPTASNTPGVIGGTTFTGPVLAAGSSPATAGATVYTRTAYSTAGVFLVNGVGYASGGTYVAPFYANPAGGGNHYNYSTFRVGIYGDARGTHYAVGLNDGGVSLGLSGHKGPWGFTATVR